MELETKKALKKLYKKLATLKQYDHAMGLLYFDLETIAPKQALEAQGDVLTFLDDAAFKISNSKEMKNLIVYLNDHKDELEYLDQVLIKHMYREYEAQKNITPEFNTQITKIYNKAHIDWLNAKEKKDYNLFKESFKNIVEMQEKVTNLRDYKLDYLYDNYLDQCEKGVLSKELDAFFDDLKKGLISLIERIKNSKHKIRADFLSREVPLYKQEEYGKYLLELNGFDFTRGAMSTTEHPFTSDIAKDDTRLTTHYYLNMFASNMYSIIHEGGHGIFMQRQKEEDYEHFINDEITNGMHESVSRFYENVLGRSKEYIHLIYPKFKEIFKDEFSDVSERELYEAVNLTAPSLIRTEADEVTYGLHIVIRYELEKAITDKKVSIDDASKKWNELYKKYLGVVPSNDSEGILQDVHWSSGFGYFPSYAIGNAYNAMYVRKMKEDINFEECVLNGKLDIINDWMQEHVFKKANELDPADWIKDITGEGLQAKYFLQYLEDKYSDIYQFEKKNYLGDKND